MSLTRTSSPIRLLLLLSLFALGSCSDRAPEDLTAPSLTEELAPAAGMTPPLASASAAVSPGVTFLPPIGQESTSTVPIDRSLLDHVSFEICQRDGSDGCGTVVATLMAADTSSPAAAPGNGRNGGGSGSSDQIRLTDEGYHGNWAVADLEPGTALRIRALVAGTDLGHVDGVVVANGRDARAAEREGLVPVHTGRTLPIKVRIDKGVVWVVDSEGRTFSTLDGGMTVAVPGGAVSDPVGLTVRPTAEPLADPTLVPGTAFDLGPAGTTFAEPAGMTLTYGDARPGSDTVPTFRFRLHRVDDAEGAPSWVQDFPSTGDEADATVTGQVDRTGSVAVLRRRPPVRVEVTPAEPTLTAFDETLTLTATAYAAGGWAIANAAFEWALQVDEDRSEEDGPVLSEPVRDGEFGETGTVAAIANGTAAVEVATEGVQGLGTVTVAQVAADIALALGAPELDALDATTTVEATAKDANGFLIEDDDLLFLTWGSGDQAVATIAATAPLAALATATGNGTVQLTAAEAAGASGSVELTVEQKPVAAVDVSGNGQVGTTGAPLPEPLVAEVWDANDHPVPGAAVTWEVLGGGGSLGATTGTTNAAGRASTTLTLGSDVVLNEVLVYADDAPLAGFEFDAVPATPPVPTSGGTVELLDGAVKLELPEGGLSTATAISVRPVDPLDLGVMPDDVLPGTVYDFGPDGLTFEVLEDPDAVSDAEAPLPDELLDDGTVPDGFDDPDLDGGELEAGGYLPDEVDTPVEVVPEVSDRDDVQVQLTLSFDALPEGLSQADEDALVIVRWDPEEETWTELPRSRVDLDAGTVTAPMEGFSRYGIRPRVTRPQIRGPYDFNPSLERDLGAGQSETDPVTGYPSWFVVEALSVKVESGNRWEGSVRKLWRNGLPVLAAVVPHGPGPWVLTATGRTCGPDIVWEEQWHRYSRWKSLVTPDRRGRTRINYEWEYVLDDDGNPLTEDQDYTRRIRGRGTRTVTATFVLVNVQKKLWTCETTTETKEFTVVNPPPASVQVLVNGHPATESRMSGTGEYDVLSVRVADDRGVQLRGAGARVTFRESAPDVLSVFKPSQDLGVTGWDNWVGVASQSGVTELAAVASNGVESGPITVTVAASEATGIQISPASVALYEAGESAALTAQVVDQFGGPMDAPVTWTSSSGAVSVAAGGQVTANGLGRATVTATTDNGVSQSVPVTVGSFTETFDDGTLDGLVDIHGAYTVSGGSIRKVSSTGPDDRAYVGTRSTRYYGADFTAEVTFTHEDNSMIHFIGVGPGLPDDGFNEPAGVFLRLHSPDNVSGRVDLVARRPNNGDAAAEPIEDFARITERGQTHRVRIVKTGKVLTFSLDIGDDGTFDASASMDVAPLETLAEPLGIDDTNTRVFFGTASTIDVFDDLVITVEDGS